MGGCWLMLGAGSSGGLDSVLLLSCCECPAVWLRGACLPCPAAAACMHACMCICMRIRRPRVVDESAHAGPDVLL
jgi:hypothetical protein